MYVCVYQKRIKKNISTHTAYISIQAGQLPDNSSGAFATADDRNKVKKQLEQVANL